MPRNDRAPSFQFYPADWLADPAVDALTFDQQGRYLRALCMTWQTDSPGVAPEDAWRVWMRYSPAEWQANRDAHARCFKVSHDNVWTQRRVVEEREAQRRRHQKAQKGGFAKAEKARSSLAMQGLSMCPTPTPSSASASSRESKSKAGTPPAPAVPLARSDNHGPVPVASLVAGFMAGLKPGESGTDPGVPAAPAFGFDLDPVAAAVSSWPLREQQDATKLAGWLWNSGTKRMDVIVWLLLHARAQGVKNPHAYFARGSPRRAELEARALEEVHEREKKART